MSESHQRQVWTFSSPEVWSMINVVIIYSYRLIELVINGNEIQKLLLLPSLFCAFITIILLFPSFFLSIDLSFILKSWHLHSNITWRRSEMLIPGWTVSGSSELVTSTVDHVAFVGFVQRPTVVLAVVQVMPATGLSHAANTHLQTHTRHKTFTWQRELQRKIPAKKIWCIPTLTMSSKRKKISPDGETDLIESILPRKEGELVCCPCWW